MGIRYCLPIEYYVVYYVWSEGGDMFGIVPFRSFVE
jgi:hypothetical protein